MVWLRQYLKNTYLRDKSEKKYNDEYKKTNMEDSAQNKKK